MLALIPDVSVQLDLAHTLLTFWTFMRTWANIQRRAHSIPKARTERRRDTLPYKLVMASSRKRGGTKPSQPPLVDSSPNIFNDGTQQR